MLCNSARTAGVEWIWKMDGGEEGKEGGSEAERMKEEERRKEARQSRGRESVGPSIIYK